MADRYGRSWELPAEELCPTCGQPDNCGDCTHQRLSDEQASSLKGYVSNPMTPKALRDIAWTLDHLSRLMGGAVESASKMVPLNADEITVTVRFTSDGDAWWNDEEKAAQLLDWVTGTDQQDDLRAWADRLEADDEAALR